MGWKSDSSTKLTVGDLEFQDYLIMDIQQELLSCSTNSSFSVSVSYSYPSGIFIHAINDIVRPLEYSSMFSLMMSSSLEDWNYSSSLSSTVDETCCTAKMIKQRWCKVSHQTS